MTAPPNTRIKRSIAAFFIFEEYKATKVRKMNWDAIGVFAEVIGAAAVVATLAYLSVQMRFAREASQVQSIYSSLSVYSNWPVHCYANGH